jgi:hypothetical protein
MKRVYEVLANDGQPWRHCLLTFAEALTLAKNLVNGGQYACIQQRKAT